METFNLLDTASTHFFFTQRDIRIPKSQFTKNPKTNRNIKLQRCRKCTHYKENDPKYVHPKETQHRPVEFIGASEGAEPANGAEWNLFLYGRQD